MVKKYNFKIITDDPEQFKGEKIIVYGRSLSALRAYKNLLNWGASVIGFSDSFVENPGEQFCELPLYTTEQLKTMKDTKIYIATRKAKYKREILGTLNNLALVGYVYPGGLWGAGEYDIEEMRKIMDADREKIDFIKSRLSDDFSIKTYENLLNYRLTNNVELIEEIYEKSHLQYFPDESILPKTEKEIFVDAGAFNGATSRQFSDWVNGKYEKIYVMEPDDLMFTITKEYLKLKKISSIELVKAGAYSSDGEIHFLENNLSGSSKISEDGGCVIKTVSIDSMLDGACATYIKMDIEGAEMEALIGADKTITNYMPKLAISIYHKDDDLWKLPYYIMKKYPDYKFFMRHYTDITTETVLYATK